ncbi:hypothetical protein B0H67DRAFT_640239 [Lasiosphaeris hirsuta]|uniref:Uncharacterized protein n=1 Tax=Lasiosphaeris hirsuta TaxID=260670 RepID=A0AA40BD01_9PEZI|nr:hypothetical protein B0H67DRAFT_640239 [Lasiosphaeris hirsuta]
MAEIGCMDLIYRIATATIIASGGSGPDRGLSGVSTRARPPQPREHVGGHDLVTSMQNPVTAYLSFQNDALNAIDGILRYYENNSAIRGYWGVPPADPATDTGSDTDSGHADPRPGPPADGYHLTRGRCWTEGLVLDAEADMLHYRRLYYRRLVCGEGMRRAGFPSWSWAGWQGTVDYRWAVWHDKELWNREATDVDIAVELRDGSLVG